MSPPWLPSWPPPPNPAGFSRSWCTQRSIPCRFSALLSRFSSVWPVVHICLEFVDDAVAYCDDHLQDTPPAAWSAPYHWAASPAQACNQEVGPEGEHMDPCHPHLCTSQSYLTLFIVFSCSVTFGFCLRLCAAPILKLLVSFLNLKFSWFDIRIWTSLILDGWWN